MFRLVEVVDRYSNPPTVTIRSKSETNFNFFFFSKIGSFATGSEEHQTGSETFPVEPDLDVQRVASMMSKFYLMIPLKSKHSGHVVCHLKQTG